MGVGDAVALGHRRCMACAPIHHADQMRRHRPTVWSIWGSAQGINAGDGVFAHAMRTLLAPGARADRRMRVAHALTAAVVDVVEGQCLDISLEGCVNASESTYLKLATAKTGALMGASLATGAIMAGASANVVRRFDDAGRLLGLAFQMRDDWLGTWGNPEFTGKGHQGDLRQRKLTYTAVAAYAVATNGRKRELRRLFADREPGAEFRLRSLLDELGGASLTAGVPLVLARDAVAALDGCGIDDTALEAFADTAIHVAERAN